MADSDFVFEAGVPVQVGSHGDHSFVFAGGDPVEDTGDSTLVFEAGTGFTHRLQFEVNGGGVQSLGPVKDSQTVEDWYGLNDTESNAGDHGYWEDDVLTVLVYENTSDGSRYLVVTADDPTVDGSTEYSLRVDFSEAFGASNTTVRDDPASKDDEYHDDWCGFGWAAGKTDGVVIPLSQFSDVTITLDHSYVSWNGAENDVADFRIITADGAAPDGGGVEYAGKDGSIRIVS